jgi:hypothetical protein
MSEGKLNTQKILKALCEADSNALSILIEAPSYQGGLPFDRFTELSSEELERISKVAMEKIEEVNGDRENVFLTPETFNAKLAQGLRIIEKMDYLEIIRIGGRRPKPQPLDASARFTGSDEPTPSA